jgi:DNA-binding NtrC family response regulator
VQRVGGRQYEPVDVRVISATRRDLRLEMNAQRFREDLYFRLAQFRVETPPLRDRLEDIPQLVSVSCARVGRPQAASRVTSYIRQRFRYYDWPGNVRELVNVASVLASLGDEVGEEMLPTEEAKASLGGDITAEEFVKAKRRFEAVYFSRMLEATDGNISEISRRCGLARHHVRSHLRKLGLMG